MLVGEQLRLPDGSGLGGDHVFEHLAFILADILPHRHGDSQAIGERFGRVNFDLFTMLCADIADRL